MSQAALLSVFASVFALVSAPALASMIEVVTPQEVAAEAEGEKTVIVIAPETLNAALETAQVHRVGDETYVTLDLIVGSISGISLGLPLLEITDSVHLSLEGLYGGGASAAGLSPVAGGGIRLQINVTQDRIGKNALFVSPGVDVYVAWDDTPDSGWIDFGPDSTVVLLASTVEVSWVHEFARHFGLELGLRLGGHVGLSGLNSSGEEVAGKFAPEIGLFLGLRF